MIYHRGYRMDSEPHVTRLNAIRTIAREQGSITRQQFSERLKVSLPMVSVYFAYLCDLDMLTLFAECSPKKGVPQNIYIPGPVDSPLPTQADDRGVRPIQRLIGANDWPRGEHAGCGGVLAWGPSFKASA